MTKYFPSINMAATGNHIRELREARGLSVKDLQAYFGFEAPQAIYKWQKGDALPSVDNLLALSTLLEVPMERILIWSTPADEPSGSVFLCSFFPYSVKGKEISGSILSMHPCIVFFTGAILQLYQRGTDKITNDRLIEKELTVMRNLLNKIKNFFSRMIERMAEAERQALEAGILSTPNLNDTPVLC